MELAVPVPDIWENTTARLRLLYNIRWNLRRRCIRDEQERTRCGNGYEKTDTSGPAAEVAANALVEIISDALKKGESLTLPGLGTFEVRERAARTGRNPKTGEELKIAASRVAAFKPGAALKAAVNGGGK